MYDPDDISSDKYQQGYDDGPELFAGGLAFEDPRHRATILGFIVKGAIPLKFTYTGSGAWTHDALAKSGPYKYVVGSVRLEAAILQAIKSRPKQVVDVGPGNGQHTQALFTKLAKGGYESERYLGLDFSRTLLEIAVARISSTMPGEPLVTIGQWDIEHGSTDQIEDWRVGEDPVLVCVLGQTLGNVENPADVLADLRQSLRTGDLLLLGLAPCSPSRSPETYLASYRSSVFRRAALEPLRMVGMDLSQIDFRLRYEDDTVIADAVLLQGVTVDGTTLERGHVVRCFLSRRFQPQAAVALLQRGGWSTWRAELDDPGDHFAVLAVKD